MENKMMLFKLFKRKDRNFEKYKKENYKEERTVNTIYGKEAMSKQTKRFYFTHFILKYKILLPALWIFNKLLGKRMVTKTPDLPQFKYIKIFEDSFDKAVIDWSYTFLQAHRPVKRTREEITKSYVEGANGGTYHFMKLIKQSILTVTTNDDAYMEFLPFMFWNIYREMAKVINEDKPYLMHTVGEVADLQIEQVYLALLKKIDNGELTYQLKPVAKQTSDECEEVHLN